MTIAVDLGHKATKQTNKQNSLSREFNRQGHHADTVKPVLNGHFIIDKTNALKTNGSLMKVECIAECSLGAFF